MSHSYPDIVLHLHMRFRFQTFAKSKELCKSFIYIFDWWFNTSSLNESHKFCLLLIKKFMVETIRVHGISTEVSVHFRIIKFSWTSYRDLYISVKHFLVIAVRLRRILIVDAYWRLNIKFLLLKLNLTGTFKDLVVLVTPCLGRKFCCTSKQKDSLTFANEASLVMIYWMYKTNCSKLNFRVPSYQRSRSAWYLHVTLCCT